MDGPRMAVRVRGGLITFSWPQKFKKNFKIKKLELVAKANHAQQQKYVQIEQEIESEMEKANKTIANSK